MNLMNVSLGQVWCYRSLPWLTISSHFGRLAEAECPRILVLVSVLFYSLVFGCDVSEANPDSLRAYTSLAAFFRRRLRPGCRPLAPGSRLVSPADGTVTFAGLHLGGSLQQVKGVHYSLPKFLGRRDQDTSAASLLRHPHTCLYQVVIYLHPGDYHRFHSPVTWRVRSRTRVEGELLSVAPPILRNIQGLFELNSRVVLEGEWRWGYFSLTAVGATNVGSINIEWETEETERVQGGLQSK